MSGSDLLTHSLEWIESPVTHYQSCSLYFWVFQLLSFSLVSCCTKQVIFFFKKNNPLRFKYLHESGKPNPIQSIIHTLRDQITHLGRYSRPHVSIELQRHSSKCFRVHCVHYEEIHKLPVPMITCTQGVSMRIFITALCIPAKQWKQSKHSLVGRWANKMWLLTFTLNKLGLHG